MTDITPKMEIDIQKELANLQLYKNHPNGILDASLNRLKDMLDGQVQVVDPSNPFIYLLETTCMNTTFAIQEMTTLSRKLYPRLANNEEDIYLHMSDEDYLGRFSTPAKADVRFNVLFNSFKTNAYRDPQTGDYLHTIPKNFKVTVDKYVFTLSAPILIRLTESGVIDVRYLGDQNDDVFDLGTTYINFDMYTVNQEESYITFEVSMHEVDLEPVEIPVEKSKLFKGTLSFNELRNFYYFKAYHMVNGVWQEMLTTHTDQVYDIDQPTCIVKVNQTDKTVQYYIPPVYVNSGRLGSKVKFVIYTTLGPINLNFSDFKVSEFRTEYNPVFPELDLDETTEALQMVPKVVFIEGKVVDGRAGKSFAQLKADVIDNNLGKNHRPVTNVQIERFMDGTNFKLVRNVDNVTNRIFLLEAKLPTSPSRYGVSRLNLGIVEYPTTLAELRDNKNQIVAVNNNVTLIPENTLFEMDAGGLRLLTTEQSNAIRGMSGNSLVKELNSKRYLSTYYHYVLDSSGNSVELRAYDISNPRMERTNFKGFNPTSRIGINTINTNIIRSSTGFQLDIATNIKRYDGQFDENNITPYLVYRDQSDTVFFLEGRLFTNIGDSPVFRFQIESKYYIDKDNRIHITNFADGNGNAITVAVGIESELEILYLTNQIPPNYEPTSMDGYIRASYLGIGNAVVTLESATFTFGHHLEYLYTRVHSSTGLQDYLTWEEDVPLLYDRTVYGEDNTILHSRNEPVFDDNGNPVYKFRKGEVKFDDNDNPIVGQIGDTKHYLNLMFVDYRVMVANDPILVEYRNYLKMYMTSSVTGVIEDLQDQLLENTIGYMTVPDNVNNVMVKYNGISGYIPAAQHFVVTLYVGKRTYEDPETRRGIELTLTEELDNYITGNRHLSRSTVLSLMLERVKDFVKSVSFDKFTQVNAEYIEVVTEGSSISFDKVLTIEPDGYKLNEAVNFNFVLVD